MKNLKQTFDRAKINVKFQNQGNVRQAKKDFSLTVAGRRTYFTVAVTNSLLAPFSETVGYTRYDINHSVDVWRWDSRSMFSGVKLSEQETANILQQCDVSDLEKAVHFSDIDLHTATEVRRNAARLFVRDFYL